jgi:hypothetical protein
MSTAKETITEIISRQPDDSSYDELLRELAYARMVEGGLADADAKRTVPDEEINWSLSDRLSCKVRRSRGSPGNLSRRDGD